MNYYIQGDPARADKIKAAFERLGINVLDFGFADKTVVYCSIGGCGGCVQYIPYSINLMHILYSHPDYQELPLSVEHKFKVEDWVVFNDSHNSIYQISEIKNSYYMLTHTHGGSMSLSFSQGEFIRPWSIEDAKDGDVLVSPDGSIIIYAGKIADNGLLYYYAALNKYKILRTHEETSVSWLEQETAKPATKEQRDLLFAKMKVEGYTWDEEKKELCKIKPNYDIANLHEGTPVLVRDDNSDEWNYLLFSHYRKKFSDHFFAGGSHWCQCVPFSEDTKHLLGTTDPCDERYVNW